MYNDSKPKKKKEKKDNFDQGIHVKLKDMLKTTVIHSQNYMKISF